MRIMLRKSVADEICRYWGFPLVLKAYNPRDPKFEYFKRKIIEHLTKLERQEARQVRKSIAYLERLEKAERKKYNPGDIATWKNGKFIKGVDKKWRRYYEGHSKQVESTITRLKGRARKCQNSAELWDLVANNWGRFMDTDKMPLPIVREFHQYVSTIEDEINAGVSVENRTSHRPKRKRSPSSAKRKPEAKGEITERDIAAMSYEQLDQFINDRWQQKLNQYKTNPKLQKLYKERDSLRETDRRATDEYKRVNETIQALEAKIMEKPDPLRDFAKAEKQRRIDSMSAADFEQVIQRVNKQIEDVLKSDETLVQLQGKLKQLRAENPFGDSKELRRTQYDMEDRMDKLAPWSLFNTMSEATKYFKERIEPEEKAKAENEAVELYPKMTTSELREFIKENNKAINNKPQEFKDLGNEVLHLIMQRGFAGEYFRTKSEVLLTKLNATHSYRKEAAKKELERRAESEGAKKLKAAFEKEKKQVLDARKGLQLNFIATADDMQDRVDVLENERYYAGTQRWYEASINKTLLKNAIKMCDLVGDPKPVTDKIGDIKKGEPMTFKQADSGSVNPNYVKNVYANKNCQTCNAVFIARMMGFDVETLPERNGIMMQLSKNPSAAFIYKKTGLPPECVYPKKAPSEQLLKWMNTNLKPATVYSIDVGWAYQRKGHTTLIWKEESPTAEKGFVLKLYDSQSNEIYIDQDIKNFLKGAAVSKTWFTNLSDCVLNESVCKHIMKKRGT